MPHETAKDANAVAFIRANTQLMSPPLVPEIVLHLAEESLPIWRRTEEELGEMNVPPPFWAFAWAGGQALARYILDVPESVAGKRVLDIGSGSGLVALAARLAGAKSAVANDIDAFALAACALNANANGLTIDIDGRDILDGGPEFDAGSDWHWDTEATGIETEQTTAEFNTSDVDIVCLGDTFYEEALAIDALFFAEKCHAASIRILVGDPSRSYFPRERFHKIADYPVPVTRELEDNEIKNSAVWQFSDP